MQKPYNSIKTFIFIAMLITISLNSFGSTEQSEYDLFAEFDKLESLKQKKEALETQLLESDLNQEQRTNIEQKIMSLEQQIDQLQNDEQPSYTKEPTKKQSFFTAKKIISLLMVIGFTTMTGKILYPKKFNWIPFINTTPARQWYFTGIDSKTGQQVQNQPIAEPDFNKAPSGHYTLEIDKGKLGHSRESNSFDSNDPYNFTQLFTNYDYQKPPTQRQPTRTTIWHYTPLTPQAKSTRLPNKPDFDTAPFGTYQVEIETRTADSYGNSGPTGIFSRKSQRDNMKRLFANY